MNEVTISSIVAWASCNAPHFMVNPESERQYFQQKERLFELEKKRDSVMEAGEIFSLTVRLLELERDKQNPITIENSENLREMLEALGKEFSDFTLTETEQTLVSSTVKELHRRVLWQVRKYGPGGTKYVFDEQLGHDINMASLQLYSFLKDVEQSRSSEGDAK